MKFDKKLKIFRRKIHKDEGLRRKLQGAKDFNAVVTLAEDNGICLSVEELQSYAEAVVEYRSLRQENLSNSSAGSGKETSNRGIWRRLFRRRSFDDIWEYEMSRLVYFSENPSHDSDARMREKGG